MLSLAQIALMTDIIYNKDLELHVQLNYSDVDDQQDSFGQFGLSEFNLRKVWDISDSQWLTLRAGLLFPPISLEHTAKGWAPTHTITPSAINTWVESPTATDHCTVTVPGGFGNPSSATMPNIR